MEVGVAPMPVVQTPASELKMNYLVLPYMRHVWYLTDVNQVEMQSHTPVVNLSKLEVKNITFISPPIKCIANPRTNSINKIITFLRVSKIQ